EKPITLQKLLKTVELGLSKSLPKLSAHSHGVLAAGVNSSQFSTHEISAAAIVEELPPEQTFNLDKPLRDARDEFEKAYFEFHLSREGGSMTRVAEKTGLERTHLYRKLKQLGVELARGARRD
ncbi:MAG: sigma-54-dependent Fis family transcriptional regulator, partial [Betaproteobacteria bacterium]|nr:sigma-54-dependent Fis family transcriptional regulator [Betaproteobacteria bacterium]